MSEVTTPNWAHRMSKGSRVATLLIASVLALGVPPDVVDQAQVDGTLELLALEQTIDAERPEFDLVEVAERSGIDQEQLRAFWRALGFPDPRPGERVFNTSDVEMLTEAIGRISDFLATKRA